MGKQRPAIPTARSPIDRISSRIRRSLELQEILDAAVAEVRGFLGTDRVKIYRFDPDGHGQVIAEAIAGDRLPSLKGLNFPAGDIPPQARELFQKARVRSIVDLTQQQILLSQPHALPSTATDDLTVDDVRRQTLADLLQRPVDPCHVEYLTLMGVKSSVVVPLVAGQRLWGLLISHHRQAKAVDDYRLGALQTIAEQIEIAIAQSELLERTRDKAQREAAINQIATLLHSPLDTQAMMQTVLEQVVEATGAAGGRLFVRPLGTEASVYGCGAQPRVSPARWQAAIEQARLAEQVQAIADVYECPALADSQAAFARTDLRSMMVVPLQYGQERLGHLTVFRREIDTERLWAGNLETDDRQDRPRESFEQWRELKQAQPNDWDEGEVELARSLGNHLAMAVMQDRLYRCEREQRELLEMRGRELNAARATAEEASRLKSDFLSSTSHELRTPLASTLNYLKILKEGFYDSETELNEYVNSAYQSTENLVNLLNDVLDIAKIEAGRMQLSLSDIDVNALLAEQQSLFALDSTQRGIEFAIDSNVERFVSDEMKLRQVLTNLISNAFKFTRSGSVRVEARALENGGVRFRIVDTGSGIDPDKQAAVFDAFVQEDGSVRRRYGGTGLGLTICKNLVELMHGQIALESEGRDRGTTVTVTLPNLSALDSTEPDPSQPA